jgi:hypothetical protein
MFCITAKIGNPITAFRNCAQYSADIFGLYFQKRRQCLFRSTFEFPYKIKENTASRNAASEVPFQFPVFNF